MGRFSIFTHNRLFRLYWAARAISVLGDSIAKVALILYVYHYNSSYTSIGILLLAQVLPQMLGPFASVLADRMEQRRLLIVCDLLQALLFGTIAYLRPSIPLLVGMIILSTLVSTVVR
jgi:MFS family permease